MFILKNEEELKKLTTKNDQIKKDYNNDLQEWLKIKNSFFSKISQKVSGSLESKEKEMLYKEKLFIYFNNLYNEIVSLNEFYYSNRYKTKTIYDQKTYEQCQKLYKKAQTIIDKIMDSDDYNLDEIIKYNKTMVLVKKYFKKIGLFMIVNTYDVNLTSDNITELENDNFDLKNIINRAFKENWSYEHFINYVSIYQKYNKLSDEAVSYLKKEYNSAIAKETLSMEYLENNPAYVILNNPSILNENPYDYKTLLNAKKKIYRLIKDCKDLDKENMMIDTIKNINLTMKK